MASKNRYVQQLLDDMGPWIDQTVEHEDPNPEEHRARVRAFEGLLKDLTKFAYCPSDELLEAVTERMRRLQTTCKSQG